MSDPSTPSKPKPGSLRDRIAAFEKSASSAPGPAPAPRPKPAGFSNWKPKPPSPPSSPSATADHDSSVPKAGGMSATDAKESIGKGGSLKERMAALQGKGAFGAPAPPPVASKPAVAKPKWKPPPPPVQPPAEEKEEGKEEEHKEEVERASSPPVKSPKPASIRSAEVENKESAVTAQAEEGKEAEADPEEEERQRRAAIAARMARLGGARLGMAPPVFGNKPTAKKSEPAMEEVEEKAEDKVAAVEPKAEEVPKAEVDVSKEDIKFEESPSETITDNVAVTSPEPEPSSEPPRKSSESSPHLTPDAESQHTRSPASMPVPAVPRRAGPPRRKTPKSPAPPPAAEKLEAEAEHVPEDKFPAEVEPTHEKVEEKPEPEHEQEAVAVGIPDHATGFENVPTPPELDEIAAPHAEKKHEVEVEEEVEHESEHDEDQEHEAAPIVEKASPPAPVSPPEIEQETEKVEEAVAETIEEEDEEEARKKRLAEKLAKMGGVNPFAPPPPLTQHKKSSASSESTQITPEPKRRESVRKSVDSTRTESTAEQADEEKAELAVSEETSVRAVEETVAEVEEEEDEEARKRRIAEKLAKMGGVNPFALPTLPQRKASTSEEEVKRPVPVKKDSVGSVEAPKRRESVRKSTGDASFVSSPPPPHRKPSIAEDDVLQKSVPTKRSSVGSIEGSQKPVPTKRSSVGSIEVPQRRESVRKSSVDSSTTKEAGNDKSEAAAKSPEIKATNAEIITEEEDNLADDDNSVVEVPETESYGNDSDEDETSKSIPKQMSVLRHESDNVSPPEEFSEERQVTPSSPPPQPIRATPVIPALHPKSPTAPVRAAKRAVSPPTVALPPRRMAPQAPSEDEAEEDDEMDESASEQLAASTLFIPPPRVRDASVDDEYESDHYTRRRRRAFDEESTDNESGVAIPIPHRASMAAAAQALASPDSDAEYPPVGTITGRPRRNIPHIPRPPSSDIGDSDFGGEMLPTRPRVSPGMPTHESLSLGVASEGFDERTPVVRSPPVGRSLPPAPEVSSPLVAVSGQEILDEEEGDPIDPFFHSPSRQTSIANLRDEAQVQATPTATLASPPIPAPAEDDEEDPEQARRRTIAQRMAKLGGIKFGAAPIPASISRRAPPPAPEEAEEELSEAAEPQELTEEEEERARKERISAKLAGMGGIRIGMMPGMPPPRPKAPEQAIPTSPPPPQRAIPPARPPPPPQAEEEEAPARPSRGPPSRPPPPPQDSEEESVYASDDGVKVEAEESEVEEVSYEDALEEVPPPVPTRVGRQSSSASARRDSQEMARSPPVSPRFPSGRPPIPTGLPMRRSSAGTAKSPTRSGSTDSNTGFAQRQSLVHKPHSEYVMVDEPDIIESEEPESPPPPPARPAHRPLPPRSVPPPPAPNPNDSISSQWELPSIPSSSLEFSGAGSSDLSMSWTEAGEPTSPPPPPPPTKEPTPPKAAPVAPTELHLTSDDLMEIWGRVGVQVCESAMGLYEKSKKGQVIGDGSYAGFVAAVLSEVPNAAGPSPHGYGYVIYAQSGSSVQKRASEIMPGDIVEVVDAKFKGHKGLQMYNLSVGSDGPLVCVVEEFEHKKSKVRVFQANQHVGQQSVESTSYRLEDLKSGTVKIYRVLPGN